MYLGGKLIAEDNNVTGVRFSHTDALGSPVARTNGAGAVIERTRYEPYGAAWAGSTNPVGIGFTGHVNDPDTGLVYMQQRYYDPIAGRFLSVDPITTDSNTGGFFNRYTYALNNPFKFVDPTGMAPDCSAIGGSTCNSTGSLSGGADAVGTAAAATTRMTSSAMTGGYSDKTIQAAESGDGVAAAVYTLAGTAVGVTNVLTIGNGSRILGLFGLAAKGPVVIGETMARVELAAAKIPGAKILNDMPDFKAMGMSAEQVTSAMMQHNRKWILEQLRSGRQIIDIGLDPNRAIPSIFYQMEKNMLKNLDKLQNSGH